MSGYELDDWRANVHWTLLRSQTISCRALKEACNQLWEEAVVDILNANNNITEIHINEPVSENILNALMSKPGIEKVRFDYFHSNLVNVSPIMDLVRLITCRRVDENRAWKVAPAKIMCQTLQTKSLQHIHLNKVNFGDSMAKSVARSPSLQSSLVSFELCYSKVGKRGFDALSRALPLFSSLRKLKIADLGLVLNSDRTRAFSEATKNHETLETLEFWSEVTGSDSYKVLAEFVSSSSLIDIDLVCYEPCCDCDVTRFFRNEDGLRLFSSKEDSLTDKSRHGFELREFHSLCDALTKSNTIECLEFELVLGEQGMVSIGQRLLSHYSALIKLDLSGNKIDDNMIVSFSKALLPNDTLQVLDLSRNDIGDRGAVALAQCITSKELSPTTLLLARNHISNEGVVALAGCHSLMKLDLSYNSIGDDMTVSFCESLLPNDTLQELDLSDNEIGDRGAAALAQCITSKKLSANTLLLGRNEIGDRGVVALIAGSPSLTKLGLSYNRIGDDTISLFCEALLPNDTLQELDLSDNEIGDRGAAALAQCIAKAKLSPKTLVLADNRIGDNGVVALAECLDEHFLKKLSLSYNPFGRKGRDAIVKALSRPSSGLEVLHLRVRYERVGNYVFESLGNMLQSNTLLKELDISSPYFCTPSVSERGIRAFLNGVKMHPTITNISLSDRTFSDLQQDELHFYLELNKGPKYLLQSKSSLPLALWPRALKRADRCRDAWRRQRAPDVLYFLVKGNCELFAQTVLTTKEKSVTGVEEERYLAQVERNSTLAKDK